MNFRPVAPTSNTRNIGEILRRFFDCRNSAFREGLLDDAFITLTRLSQTYPDFPINSIRFFLEESQRCLTDLTYELVFDLQFDRGKPDPAVDFNKLRTLSWALRVCSVSVGAKALLDVCDIFRTTIGTNNVDQCRRALQSLTDVYARTRSKLETIYELGLQLLAGGTLVPWVPPPPSL